MFASLRKTLSFEILGIPVLPALAGSFVLMATMFMWYGSFFVDHFHAQMGIVEAQVTADALGIWYLIGLISSMSQGVGLAVLLKMQKWPSILKSVQVAFLAAVFLGATTFAYPLIILPSHDMVLFLVNASGLITAWSLGALAFATLRVLVAHKQPPALMSPISA